LIVATSEYRDPEFGKLVAPAQDADALAKVLRDARIGNYTVTEVRNAESSKISEEIEAFWSERARDDLSLLYFSCHGVKGKDGRLYLAASNTRQDRLRSTSVSASFVNEVMAASDSRRQVLILDCCYSGAFSRGMQVKSGGQVSVMEDFQGEGRVVLTASTAMQYAFVEDEGTQGQGARSLLTSSLVDGLETGEADSDGDGRISFDELYTFVRERVRERSRDQSPERSYFGLKGDLILARSAAPRLRRAATAVISPPAVPRIGGDALDEHCQIVASLFRRGAAVPILGESVNLCGTSAGREQHSRGRRPPPTEAELVDALAATFDCPPSDAGDLMSVADYVTVMYGFGELYEELRKLLANDYQLCPLHRLLAESPKAMRGAGQCRGLVILTTNYDTALEQAFHEEKEPFDLVAYDRNMFTHYPPEGDPVRIDAPNRYSAVKPEERPVIVKLRGGVDLAVQSQDGYVITEEDHLDLSGSGIPARLPVFLRAHLDGAAHLFLGQNARLRGVRMVLNQILGARRPYSRKDWTVETDPDEAEMRFWTQKDVELMNVDLEDYAEALSQHLA